jgi:hypothetical protein
MRCFLYIVGSVDLLERTSAKERDCPDQDPQGNGHHISLPRNRHSQPQLMRIPPTSPLEIRDNAGRAGTNLHLKG